mmetsp:Transcript_9338/g.34244  ORF Transcript_9338/g.34244 Transcript_9338/m.34244 type:complete len:181 (+) Transcript_9338:578-1120(+)
MSMTCHARHVHQGAARHKLINYIREAERSSTLKARVHLVQKWDNSYSNASGYLGQEDYQKLLLDSMFTLSPSGHSPECYRQYEAVDAGSIPVIVDAGYGPCGDSFHHFMATTAPFIRLGSWSQLPDFMRGVADELLTHEGRVKWDRHQQSMEEWSTQFQQMVLSSVELHLHAGYEVATSP